MSLQTWIYKFSTDCTLHQVQSVLLIGKDCLKSLSPIPLFLLLFFVLSGCCSNVGGPHQQISYVSATNNIELQDLHPPQFYVQSGEYSYNAIGTPEVVEKKGKPEVRVNHTAATLYFEENHFSTEKSKYTNHIYRLHFSKVPFDICNLNITAGNNPGLLIIYTIDSQGRTVLITTVHTCGCYLAFFPTTDLAKEAFPDDWPGSIQSVYGYKLPSIVASETLVKTPYIFSLASGTHRINEVSTTPSQQQGLAAINDMTIQPLSALYQLPYQNGVESFFETEGTRSGYVRNNSKPLERLLISWWAFDWHVGEDKAYGKRDYSAPPFYTSLKFWQRENSDMNDFPRFLSYWGWKL